MRSVRQLRAALRERSLVSAEERFLEVRLSDLRVANCDPPPVEGVLDLVTIAHNSSWAIEEQVKRLRANLHDPYRYSVLDNSSNPDERRAIEVLCAREGITYISLPPNPCRDPSASHGLALTWAWRSFLAPRNAQYAGFLDHDVFPMRSTHVISKLSPAGVYGYQQEHDGAWYLWPGFCFFESRTLQGISVDFRPAPGLDTGGALWSDLYSNLERSSVLEPVHRYETLDEPTDLKVEYFDEWVHTINASNWVPAASRTAFIRKWLASL